MVTLCEVNQLGSAVATILWRVGISGVALLKYVFLTATLTWHFIHTISRPFHTKGFWVHTPKLEKIPFAVTWIKKTGACKNFTRQYIRAFVTRVQKWPDWTSMVMIRIKQSPIRLDYEPMNCLQSHTDLREQLGPAACYKECSQSLHHQNKIHIKKTILVTKRFLSCPLTG